MSPRPRTVDDATILDAAIRVLSRIGSERLTLADVGAEAGLSAATLVQRFGSKRELMLALMRHAIDSIDTRFVNSMATTDSPLEALFAAAADRVEPREGPVTVANRLAFVLGNMDDPEFQALALEDSNRAIEGYKRMIEKAVAAGELIEGYLDSTQLAQTIHTVTFGSLVTWSISANTSGPLRAKVRRDLDVLLRPFRRGPRKAAGATATESTERAHGQSHDRNDVIQFADRAPLADRVERKEHPDSPETTLTASPPAGA
jgi:AcrR family transcriptional regulator